MAAFTHASPDCPSRFSDGSYGVYYVSKTLNTAIEETKFHRATFLAHTKEDPGEIDMRAYIGEVVRSLHDIRGDGYEALHLPDDWHFYPNFNDIFWLIAKCADFLHPHILNETELGKKMINEILSPEDLRELSQFKSYARIRNWLDEAGVPYFEDQYGRPRVHRCALRIAMGGGYPTDSQDIASQEQEPNWDSIR